MPITKQDANKLLVCPHCGKEQEEIALDYTISCHVGDASEAENECAVCYKEFSIVNNGDNTVSIYSE